MTSKILLRQLLLFVEIEYMANVFLRNLYGWNCYSSYSKTLSLHLLFQQRLLVQFCLAKIQITGVYLCIKQNFPNSFNGRQVCCYCPTYFTPHNQKSKIQTFNRSKFFPPSPFQKQKPNQKPKLRILNLYLIRWPDDFQNHWASSSSRKVLAAQHIGKMALFTVPYIYLPKNLYSCLSCFWPFPISPSGSSQ